MVGDIFCAKQLGRSSSQGAQNEICGTKIIRKAFIHMHVQPVYAIPCRTVLSSVHNDISIPAPLRRPARLLECYFFFLFVLFFLFFLFFTYFHPFLPIMPFCLFCLFCLFLPVFGLVWFYLWAFFLISNLVDLLLIDCIVQMSQNLLVVWQ